MTGREARGQTATRLLFIVRRRRDGRRRSPADHVGLDHNRLDQLGCHPDGDQQLRLHGAVDEDLPARPARHRLDTVQPQLPRHRRHRRRRERDPGRPVLRYTVNVETGVLSGTPTTAGTFDSAGHPTGTVSSIPVQQGGTLGVTGVAVDRFGNAVSPRTGATVTSSIAPDVITSAAGGILSARDPARLPPGMVTFRTLRL